MSTVRRRILRNGSQTVADQREVRRSANINTKLARDRLALNRWMTKLRRAFNTVCRLQTSIDRREKQLRELSR